MKTKSLTTLALLGILLLYSAASPADSNGGQDGTAKRKVFTAGLSLEAHTGAPFFTRLEHFGDDWSGAFKEQAEQRGWELAAGKVRGAPPAGPVLAHAYESLKVELLGDLRSAMPVDMVVLILHGAMVAQGEDDVEGDVLEEIRQIVGPDVPIGAGLDAHTHLSQRMVDMADILVFFKEWPHIDAMETFARAFELTADVADGKIKPHMSVYDLRMIESYLTLEEPMKPIVDDMKAAEKDEDVVVVNLIHGFPYGDVPAMGSKMLVITDNVPQKGAELAEHFAHRVFAVREQTGVPLQDLDEGLDAVAASTNHPTVVADYSDMTSGGAPGDATFILQGLIERGVEDGIIAGLWDPMVVDIAEDLSPGDRAMVRLGGKTGPMSNVPLDLEVEVVTIRKNVYLGDIHTRMATEEDGAPVGTMAVLRTHGIDVVVANQRYPIYGYPVLEDLGLKPAERRFIVVKSGNQFYSGYIDIAGDVVYVVSPGLLGRVGDMQMKRIQRPKWPYDENPFD